LAVVQALSQTAARVLKTILDGQPLGAAKVAFAWHIAAGPTIAAASTVRWSDGRLCVRARSETWRQEILRVRPIVLARVQALVGVEAVKSLELDALD
jgi:hypothetical protein